MPYYILKEETYQPKDVSDVKLKSINDVESTDTPIIPAALWPNSVWRTSKNGSEPVIISAVQSGHAGDAIGFLKNTKAHFPNSTIVLFNLGLSSHELHLVEQYCDDSLQDSDRNDTAISGEIEGGHLEAWKNTKYLMMKKNATSARLNIRRDNGNLPSQIRALKKLDQDEIDTGPSTSTCQIRQFDSDNFFPSHTQQLSNRAFRPLAIQSILKYAGCILWMEIEERFVTGDISKYLRFAVNVDF